MLIVPLGSTEQHGPHLPIETDTIIATALVAEICRRTGASSAPALPYGSAGEHQSFAGTLSIGGPALHSIIIELARSARHHYEAIAFVSGHGGNSQVLQSAVAQLRAEGHNACGIDPIIPGADAHAGLTETSIMLHLAPELVQMGKAETGNTSPLSELMDAMQAGGIAAVSANGILGDPTSATAEQGKLLFDGLVERAITRLNSAL